MTLMVSGCTWMARSTVPEEREWPCDEWPDCVDCGPVVLCGPGVGAADPLIEGACCPGAGVGGAPVPISSWFELEPAWLPSPESCSFSTR